MVNSEKTYTAQADAHGNIIVCRGNEVRNSYKVIGTGTYKEMLELKLRG